MVNSQSKRIYAFQKNNPNVIFTTGVNARELEI